jgi:hypothetical protein
LLRTVVLVVNCSLFVNCLALDNCQYFYFHTPCAPILLSQRFPPLSYELTFRVKCLIRLPTSLASPFWLKLALQSWLISPAVIVVRVYDWPIPTRFWSDCYPISRSISRRVALTLKFRLHLRLYLKHTLHLAECFYVRRHHASEFECNSVDR